MDWNRTIQRVRTARTVPVQNAPNPDSVRVRMRGLQKGKGVTEVDKRDKKIKKIKKQRKNEIGQKEKLKKHGVVGPSEELGNLREKGQNKF